MQAPFQNIWGAAAPPAPSAAPIIGGRIKSWLPVDYKLPVVFGLVVNFGDEKIEFEFPTQVSDSQLSESMVVKNCWQRNFITTLKLTDGAYFQTIPFFVK